MKKSNGKQMGNYIIHGMLIAQLFALIFIQLRQTNLVCRLTGPETVVCLESM